MALSNLLRYAWAKGRGKHRTGTIHVGADGRVGIEVPILFAGLAIGTQFNVGRIPGGGMGARCGDDGGSCAGSEHKGEQRSVACIAQAMPVPTSRLGAHSKKR